MPKVLRSLRVFATEQGLILRGVKGSDERADRALQLSYGAVDALSPKRTQVPNAQASKALTVYGIVGTFLIHSSLIQR